MNSFFPFGIVSRGSKAVICFNWHVGELLLAGLPFFEKAMEGLQLLRKYGIEYAIFCKGYKQIFRLILS